MDTVLYIIGIVILASAVLGLLGGTLCIIATFYRAVDDSFDEEYENEVEREK